MTKNDYRRIPPNLTNKQELCVKWFKRLQDDLCKTFENLELEYIEPISQDPSNSIPHFQRRNWRRAKLPHEELTEERDEKNAHTDSGGGNSAILSGRVFEKAGVHMSQVRGQFSPELRTSIPGADEDGNFWAAGISVIAHPLNPHVPAVHFNTRMIVTNQLWFGGGADLTPMLSERRSQTDPDSYAFHEAMRQACDTHKDVDYEKLRQLCDEYFFLPHRGEIRGIGGIFIDHHNSGDWEADFRFIQQMGRNFLKVYPEIVHRNQNTSWGEEQRREQLIRRGRYVEFNLLYDRGTRFGLMTGGNIESILSSLPPQVSWP